MYQFIIRVTDGKESRYVRVQAPDQIYADMAVERFCKGTKWRLPIFHYE
jgi:hypothetical protein